MNAIVMRYPSTRAICLAVALGASLLLASCMPWPYDTGQACTQYQADGKTCTETRLD